MFLLNSRLGLFSAAASLQHPFSRSYGVILPSSLTRVLPFVLGFSPRLPVSVCGTGTASLFSSFSRQCEIRRFATLIFAPHQSSGSRSAFFTTLHPRSLHGVDHHPARRILLCHCFIWRAFGGAGISTCSPSPTTFRPRLRPRLTLGGRAFPRKP